MKKHFYVLALAGLLGLNSCSDSFEPSVDFGDKTYINDYSALVDAVNDLSKTLSERLSALNNLMEQGFLSIKVAIDENTGAITTQTTTLKDGLGNLNTTILDGLTALKTTTEANGDKLVSAINKNGEVIALQLDTTGKLISAQISGSIASLISTLKSNNTDLSSKLSAINSSISTGLADVSLKIDGVDGSIKAQTSEIKNIDSSIKAQTTELGKLTAEVLAGFKGVNTNLSTINTSLGSINTNVASVKTAIEAMDKALGLKFDANTAELKNIVTKINDNTTAINKVSEDLSNDLKSLNESLTSQGGKLVAAINEQGELIVAAINGQGDVLKTISTGITTIGTKLDTTNSKLDTINGSLGSLNTSLTTINGNIVAMNTSLGTLNTNIETLATKIEKGDSTIVDAIKDLKKYENGVIYDNTEDSDKDGIYDAVYVTPAAWGAMDDAAKKALGNTLETIEANPTGVQAVCTPGADHSTLLALADHSNKTTLPGHIKWIKTGDSGHEVVISATIIKDGVTLFKVVKVLTYSIFTTQISSSQKGDSVNCGYGNAYYVHIKDARGISWPLDYNSNGNKYVSNYGEITSVRLYLYDEKTGVFCQEPSGRTYSTDAATGTSMSSYEVPASFYGE